MDAHRLQGSIAAAIALGALCPSPQAGDAGAAVVLHDLDRLDAEISALVEAFPPGTLHAIAVKANPVAGILDRICRRGLGLECASGAELALALQRCPPERVVFDSPCKTLDDLRRGLFAGVHLNADSLQELDRIDQILGSGPVPGRVGLRVNPVVGAGAIEATSTAVKGSKFGVDAQAERGAIVARFQRHPWLRALHVHVGSAGCSLELLARGAASLLDLAQEIEDQGGRVEALDIGGGLPVGDSLAEQPGPSPADYVAVLRDQAPGLFSGRYRLLTEMGRRVQAAAGVAVSRVEATKHSGGRRIAVLHLGADMFLRAALLPAQWRYRITVHQPDGSPKTGPRMPWDIVGPLCFSGDRLARGRQLPPIEPGDLVAVHDVGAYTLAMWSRYNSRRAPAVLGIEGSPPRALPLKPAETEAEVLAFWGA